MIFSHGGGWWGRKEGRLLTGLPYIAMGYRGESRVQAGEVSLARPPRRMPVRAPRLSNTQGDNFDAERGRRRRVEGGIWRDPRRSDHAGFDVLQTPAERGLAAIVNFSVSPISTIC